MQVFVGGACHCGVGDGGREESLDEIGEGEM